MTAIFALFSSMTGKILGGVALSAILLLGFQQFTDHYREQGRVEVRNEWTAQNYLDSQVETRAVEARIAENIKQKKINELINQEAKNYYEKRLSDQTTASNISIAGLRAAGGLRIKAAIAAEITGSGTAGKADSESTVRNNGPGSTRLPQQIEDDLLQFALDRDKEIILLGACQSWIRDNGFYP